MAKPPKLLTRRHSMFHEETTTNPAGEVLRLKRIKTTAGVHFVVSVNGKRVDSFLKLGRAQAKLRELCGTRAADETQPSRRDRRGAKPKLLRTRSGEERRRSNGHVRRSTSGLTWWHARLGAGWVENERGTEQRRKGPADRRTAHGE